ncbi:MAG TPA: class I SAM-dependent rRNA methyltransferase [Thermoanaerobaculia bacterium]
MIRLRLKKGREESLRRRHPWLFSGAIADRDGDGSDGVAEVVDASGEALAHGAWSPRSQIEARLWSFDRRPPGEALFLERFRAARALRERTLPPQTTGYRAVSSEGDLCPGVVMDVYGDTAVLELLTGGTEVWEKDLSAAAREVFSPRELLVRKSAARRDRGEAEPPSEREEPGDPAAVPARAAFLEAGLKFYADLSAGQKTGFYLDQRENRIRLRRLARGARVLNLFSYSGAFSIAALASGAVRAVDVDSSEAALGLSREHRRANGLPEAEEDFVRADVFEDVRRRAAAGERWDVVICDPPAFAKKRSDLERAPRAYKDVNRLAMTLVAPGGWLLTCSCSGHVSADLFQKIVFSASLEAGARMTIAARQGAGEDHPVSLDCPEGEYLKGLWLRREP